MDLSGQLAPQLAAGGGADDDGSGQLSGWGGGEGTGAGGWTGQHGHQSQPLSFVGPAGGDYHTSSPYAPVGHAGASSWMGAAPPASLPWPASTSASLANPFPPSQHLSDLGFPSSAYDPPAAAPQQHHHQLPDYSPHDAPYLQLYTAQQAGLPFAHLPSHPPSASHHQYLHPPPPPELAHDPSYPSELRHAAPKRRREQSQAVAVAAPPFALGAPSFYVAQSDGTGTVSTPTVYLHAAPSHGAGHVEFPQVATFEPALPPNLEANYAVYPSHDGAAPQHDLWYLPDPRPYQPAPAVVHQSHPAPEHSALPAHFRSYDSSLASVRRHSYAPDGSASMSVPERSSSVVSARARPAAAPPRAGLDPFSLAQLGTPTSIAPLPSRASTFTLPAPSAPPASTAPAASRSGTSTPSRPVHRPPAPPAPAPPHERTPSPLLAPEADEDLAQVVALASIRRALHETLPPPLACKPARGAGAHAARPSAAAPAASTSSRRRPTAFSRASERDVEAVEERDLLRSSGKVNRNQQKEVSSIEILARCATCTVVDPSGAVEPRTLARLVLRALPAQLVNAIEQGSPPTSVVRVAREPGRLDLGASCWACLGAREGDSGVVRAGGQSYADEGTVARQSKAAVRQRQKGYDATLSAAIDKLEQLGLDGAEAGSPSASPGSAAGLGMSPRQQEHEEATRAEHNSLLLYESAKAPTEFKSGWLRCDVCDFICGVGSAVPVVPAAAQPHGFTVEVICARCSALFRCCSDCGGGGGRLTPGRWRCKELFPDGRKTCQLSHARNPALGEVTIEVLAVADVPPAQLEVLESRCRAIYFNSRLAVVARPEFLLRGDGLARSFREAEAVTVDHWGQLATVLREPPPEGKNIKRYITGMYSTPRKRHPKRGKGKEREAGPDSSARTPNRVAFGFSITEADFDLGTLFFCCVMPWPVNGQAFDATTILGEAITQRVKADRVVLNQQRALASPPLPSLPPFTYNYIASPFRVGSRANASLARRGFETVEELAERDPQVRPEWFKVGWLPDKYAAALTIFIRRLESEDDLGGPPTENAPRKRIRKSLAATTTTTTSSSESPSTSSRSVEPSTAEGSPFGAPGGGYAYALGPPYGVPAHYVAPPPPLSSSFGAP
ncbi:hypothetical protein JCM8208_000426 [Rhodotorula glutinis]